MTIRDYRFAVEAGRTLEATLELDNRFLYFNVIAPGADTALFVGSLSGDACDVTIPTTGTGTITGD